MNFARGTYGDRDSLRYAICAYGLDAAAYIAIAGTALAAVGTAVSVAGAMSAADAQAQAANYNAMVARNAATAAQQQAQQTAEIQQRQAKQQLGAISVGYGASGVTSEGSPLDVLASSASNSELDRQNIIYHGNLQAAGYGDEASLDAARVGSAQTAGMTSAAGLLLSGGSKVATQGSALLTSKSSFDIPSNVDAPGSGVGFGGGL
jgi:hypothetical protein